MGLLMSRTLGLLISWAVGAGARWTAHTSAWDWAALWPDCGGRSYWSPEETHLAEVKGFLPAVSPEGVWTPQELLSKSYVNMHLVFYSLGLVFTIPERDSEATLLSPTSVSSEGY